MLYIFLTYCFKAVYKMQIISRNRIKKKKQKDCITSRQEKKICFRQFDCIFEFIKKFKEFFGGGFIREINERQTT